MTSPFSSSAGYILVHGLLSTSICTYWTPAGHTECETKLTQEDS